MPPVIKKKEADLLPKPVSRLDEGIDLKFPAPKSQTEQTSFTELLFPAKSAKFWDAAEKYTRNFRDGAFLALSFVGGMAVAGVVFPLVSLALGGTLFAVAAGMLVGGLLGYGSGFLSGAFGAILENTFGTEKQNTFEVAKNMAIKGGDYGMAGATFYFTPSAMREAVPKIAKTYFSSLSSRQASSGFVSGFVNFLTDEQEHFVSQKEFKFSSFAQRGIKAVGLNTVLAYQTGYFFLMRKTLQTKLGRTALISAETLLIGTETTVAEKLLSPPNEDLNSRITTGISTNILIYGPLSMIGSKGKLITLFKDIAHDAPSSKIVSFFIKIPVFKQVMNGCRRARAWSHGITEQYLNMRK